MSQFYTVLHTSPRNLHRFYSEASTLTLADTRPNGQHIVKSVTGQKVRPQPPPRHFRPAGLMAALCTKPVPGHHTACARFCTGVACSHVPALLASRPLPSCCPHGFEHAQSIHEMVMNQGLEDTVTEVYSVDSQYSLNGGVVVQVTGTQSNKVRRGLLECCP